MSNLFDILKYSTSVQTKDHGDESKSPKTPKEPASPVKNDEKSGQSPQITHISPSKHDRVLDVDNLRTFTIPKAKKQKGLHANLLINSYM